MITHVISHHFSVDSRWNRQNRPILTLLKSCLTCRRFSEHAFMFEFMGLSETFKKLQNIFIWNQKVNRVKIKCHLDMQMQLCFDQKCNLRRCCNKWKVVIYWIVLQKAKHFNSCTYKVDFRTKINTIIILILLHRIYKI